MRWSSLKSENVLDVFFAVVIVMLVFSVFDYLFHYLFVSFSIPEVVGYGSYFLGKWILMPLFMIPLYLWGGKIPFIPVNRNIQVVAITVFALSVRYYYLNVFTYYQLFMFTFVHFLLLYGVTSVYNWRAR